MLCEVKMLPVRNTFLHFPDSEAPDLQRSLTAPLSGANKVNGKWDDRWSASADKGEVLQGECGVERHEEDRQPGLDRVVTLDPFESLCSSTWTGASCCGLEAAACMQPAVPQNAHNVFELYFALQSSDGAHAGVVRAHHMEAAESCPVGTVSTSSQQDSILDAARCGATSKASGAFDGHVVQPSWGMGKIASSSPCQESHRTTVMLRNLPNNYTRAILLKLLDSEGFAGKYDFVYLPIDFRTHAALGYAFVNLVSSEHAEYLHKHLNGFSKWMFPSSKRCSVSWSNPHQGLESHIARYRNSPLMHEVVPDEYRPVLFRDGKRIPFPPPTKKIKFPRQGTERMLVAAKSGA